MTELKEKLFAQRVGDWAKVVSRVTGIIEEKLS